MISNLKIKNFKSIKQLELKCNKKIYLSVDQMLENRTYWKHWGCYPLLDLGKSMFLSDLNP
jgi:hypothetical protein